jgi:N-dimethylarginine dimethylaminohydrolase
MTKINQIVLMSGAEYFNDEFAINAQMNSSIKVNGAEAVKEHNSIRDALVAAGVNVKQIPAPADCQDGVYTANWALVKNNKAVMSRLPNKRKAEESYALAQLKVLGVETVILPESVERFSGQGDALPCGDILFTQSPYRTTADAHGYVKTMLGFNEVISLQTKPKRWFKFGPAKINKITGWPDSPTYDIDLALSILKWPEGDQKGLIAYCPAVFKKSSRQLLKSFDKVDKIEVDKNEALNAFCLNLVSTGETVILNNNAPKFQADLEKHGLKTVTLSLPELRKGGGSIRCSTLTLDN